MIIVGKREKATSAFSEPRTESSSLGPIDADFAQKKVFSYNINDKEVIEHSPRTSKGQIERLVLETMALISILKAIHVIKCNFNNRKFTLQHNSHLCTDEIVCWLPNKSTTMQ